MSKRLRKKTDPSLIAIEEEDRPLKDNFATNELSKQTVDEFERQLVRDESEQRWKQKSRSFQLTCMCIIVLLIVFSLRLDFSTRRQSRQ